MSMAMMKALFKGTGKTTSQIFEMGKAKPLQTALSVGLPVSFGAMEYKQAREEGNGIAMSSARAVGEFALGEMTGFWGYMGIQAAAAAPKAVMNTALSLEAMSRTMNRQTASGPFALSNFTDSQQSYTMRQAGMQLAQASKYNLQQTLMGNEAQYMKY